jgi:hypothetical protein
LQCLLHYCLVSCKQSLCQEKAWRLLLSLKLFVSTVVCLYCVLVFCSISFLVRLFVFSIYVFVFLVSTILFFSLCSVVVLRFVLLGSFKNV